MPDGFLCMRLQKQYFTDENIISDMNFLGIPIEIWFLIIIITAAIVAVTVFILILYGLLSYKRYPKSEIQKKYAFFIPARNEENVIANTIASIRAMDYPQEKITIFVLANNCTDNTAAVAREAGAEVFELIDKSVVNVGMVINRFFDYISERYGSYEEFDGYVRLDADNLVHKDYLSKLNDAFCAHPTVVTSYRANQNFNDGVRASLTCMLMSQSMMAFRLFSGWGVNPIITGPGILIGAEILKKMNGWQCTTISEDLELSALLVKLKIKVHFCYDAIFYDEQPNKLKMAFRQRLRWATGVSNVFFKYWFIMIARIFSRMGLSALFIAIGLVPMGLLTVIFSAGFAIYGIILAIAIQSFTPLLLFLILPVAVQIALGWFMAVITLIIERRRIKISSFKRKFLYVLAFPLSYAMQNLADFARIFIRVKWKPIPHGLVKEQQALNLNKTETIINDTVVNTDNKEMCENIIEVRDLYKSFGDIKAVDGISFNVKRGELFTFLGLNGAGKSTTINILCSILKKDSGTVLIDGLDLDKDSGKIKEKIGIVFQGSVLDNKLTVLDNLKSRAALYNLSKAERDERIARVTEIFNLGEVLKRRYERLSGGQRRRVDIARAILHEPQILFLDEPTTGLDPNTRITVWQTIENLVKEKDLTVFLTTHYMEEVTRADSVIIIDEGRIAASGTPFSLKSAYTSDFLRLIMPQNETAEAIFIESGKKYAYKNNSYYIEFESCNAAHDFLNTHTEFSDFEILKGDMDDVFLNITGKKLENNDGI